MDESVFFIVIIICGVICGIIAKQLGDKKGLNGCFWYGFLLGIIGIVIVACMKEGNEFKRNQKYDKLIQLQKLKEIGAITDKEFDVEKQKILYRYKEEKEIPKWLDVIITVVATAIVAIIALAIIGVLCYVFD